MSLPPKKRAAPEPSLPLDAKRPRTAASKTPEVQKSDDAFKVSVEMNEDFSVYPDTLLEIAQKRHEILINHLISKFETGTPLQRQFNYTITRKSISKPKDSASDYENHREEACPAVSFANKQALEEFRVKVPSKKKKKFVELQMPQNALSMANPAFAELHSVHASEMSWGFDKFACISLHLTQIEGGRLKHESIYVERKSIKVSKTREDDDCQVVENPNAAKT